MKPSLTGSYMVDDELHMIIELFIRDYVDSWYKTNISSKDDFTQLVRLNVYNAIRHFNLCLKSLDCEHFLMNILAHNLVIQMRILKKSKEKVSSASNSIKNNIIASSILNSDTTSSAKLLLSASQSIAAQNESNLIDTFFDLEAEIEKNVCRDQISYSSLEKEQGLSFK
jgi:sorting nexin-13